MLQRLSLLLLLASAASTASAQCELQRFSGSDSQGGDRFGQALARRGNRLVVGAPFAPEGGVSRGAVYVLERGPGGWSELTKLTPGDPTNGKLFGWSVDIEGDRVVVGAINDSQGGINAGAAYVFEASGGAWTQARKLVMSDAFLGDFAGISVSIDGDRLAVGACQLVRFQVLGQGRGMVYLFDRLAGVWTEGPKLTASDGAHGDRFGVGVSLQGARLAIGAEGDDDRGKDSGSVYVFDDVGAGYVQVDKFAPADGKAQDLFGEHLSLSGDRLAVGAYQHDAAGNDAGAAYVLERQGGSWVQLAKLTASDAAADDHFARTLDLSADGTRLVLGKSQEPSGGPGAVYLFAERGGAWSELAKLVASDTVAGDELGYAVALEGTELVTGAPQSGGAGAAYEFSVALAGSTFRNGSGTNPASFVETSPPVVGGAWGSTIDVVTPGAFASFVAVGLGPLQLPTQFGELLVDLTLPLLGVDIAVGVHAIGLPPDCGLVGTALFAQGGTFRPGDLRLVNALDPVLGW